MILSVDEVRFSYGAVTVLDGITIGELDPGKITATIGPNAAGKTTLFKCIAGLLKPEGSIRLGGKDLRQHSREEITKKVSYLPQDSPVNSDLSDSWALTSPGCWWAKTSASFFPCRPCAARSCSPQPRSSAR